MPPLCKVGGGFLIISLSLFSCFDGYNSERHPIFLAKLPLRRRPWELESVKRIRQRGAHGNRGSPTCVRDLTSILSSRPDAVIRKLPGFSVLHMEKIKHLEVKQPVQYYTFNKCGLWNLTLVWL